MAPAQKPHFVFRQNGQVHLNQPGASVQSTTGSRGVRISGRNAGYTMFWGSVKSTGYPLHWPVSPSLPLPCVIVCHNISTGLYKPLGLQQLTLCIQRGDYVLVCSPHRCLPGKQRNSLLVSLYLYLLLTGTTGKSINLDYANCFAFLKTSRVWELPRIYNKFPAGFVFEQKW